MVLTHWSLETPASGYTIIFLFSLSLPQSVFLQPMKSIEVLLEMSEKEYWYVSYILSCDLTMMFSLIVE